MPRASGLRVVVLISGSGSTLANLIERIADGRMRGVCITRVVSSRAAVRGVEIAREAGIPVAIVRRRDFASDDAFSDAVAEQVDRGAADLVVMAGYLCFWKVPPRYAGRVLNIHPAILPGIGGKGMYGLHVHAAVLERGLAESGCTVHVVNDEYDSGPVVAQTRVPVLPGDTPESLAERVQAAERELYPRVIQEVAERGVGALTGHTA